LPISAVDAINPAFRHTKDQLLHPFRAAEWAKLAFVGFLAGELSSGGCNGSSFQTPGHPRGGQPLPLPHINNLLLYASLIALLIVVAVVLWIVFLYVSSVMRFILFDSVIAKRCEIRRGWARRHPAGLRYFVWQLLFILAMFVGLTVLVGIPAAFALAAGWLKDPQRHMLPLILGGVLLFFAVIGLILLSLVVHVLTKDFVVPEMALENISAFEGWRRLMPMLRSEKSSYAGYLGMKIVMAVAASVAVGILTVIVVLVLLIPVGGFGVVAVILGKTAGLSWNLYTITLAVVVGCIVIAVLLYVMALISVPAIVFFPAYSIYFFASRYPVLDALLRPPSMAIPVPPLAPPSPPPEPIG
jgi:MFS family permease